jgi:hypothetical protein
MHLCFSTSWGTSWIPLCYVFYKLETNKYLSMHYYSWSFVYATFHVITWLLSSVLKIMSFMPMFRVLWSQHSILYIVDQDCVGACHLKNYCFVITYLLEDEQELSLGCLVRFKCIYNFWCSMLVLHQLLHVLFTLCVIFMHFLELTY